ncbi:KIF-binding protein-like [Diprion similis]|uniref:KIF-binding protein-like n=1 Tax=Diprion similis TaxID=362088 RepID=UPI001EF7F591|nr:KIF-binding protein-like [Diprion similis]
MEESQTSMKSNFEFLHEQFQHIKKFQKVEDCSDKNDLSVNLSEEMKNAIEPLIEMINSMMIPDSPMSLRLLAMKTTLSYEQSKILMNLNEEKAAEKVLDDVLDSIKNVMFKPEIIFLTLRIINHYSYLLSKQEEFEKPKQLLELAESTYKSLKKQNSHIKFYTSDDLFSPDTAIHPTSNSSNKLERLVTNNLQMLGYIYNKKGLYDKFAEYHHEVLRRQLEMNDGDVTLWALKSARLASYFLTKNRFNIMKKSVSTKHIAGTVRAIDARHHLAAAIYMLYKYEKELKALKSSNSTIMKILINIIVQYTYRWEQLQRRFADIAKCWVKYGLFLFSVSKTSIVSSLLDTEPNQILEKPWSTPFITSNECKPSTSKETTMKYSFESNNKEVPVTRSFEDMVYEKSQFCSEKLPSSLSFNFAGPFLLFPSLDIAEYEEQVTASPVQTATQARALFLYTHSWLKRAKVFYTLQDHPMDYVSVILDLSELYKHLTFYEEDIESQYAIQKLRADALESLSAVLREMRPQCYIAVSVELLRELAEVHLEMMGLNLKRIYVAQEAAPEASDMTVRKMEALADMHSKLEQFGDNVGCNIDPVESGLMPVSDMAGDVCQFINT